MKYICLICLTLVCLIQTGCNNDNGLPDDLIGHLTAHGIAISVVGSDAPLRSREGYISFAHDPVSEAKIVDEFNLIAIPPSEAALVTNRLSIKVQSAWRITGRPATLKLKNGSQLEYLYMVVDEDGQAYIFSQYAYG